MILLNAKLVQDPVAVAGVMLRNFRAFESTLLPVFHLEQFDPEDDKEHLAVEAPKLWEMLGNQQLMVEIGQ